MDREDWDDEEFDLEAIQARQEAFEEELARQEALEEELARQKAPEEEAAGQEAPMEEAAGKEAPEEKDAGQKAPEEEAAGKEAPEEKIAGQEAPMEEAVGKEAPEEKVAGQKAPEEGPADRGPTETEETAAGRPADAYDPETDWEAVVEAVLFTMGGPVELTQLAVAIGQDTDMARKTVENLAWRYDHENRGRQVSRLEDSYQLCTRGRFYGNLIRVAAAPRRQVLTDVALETLAIIAYKQPVTRAEIEKIRGVNSDHAVSRLVEYGLAEEIGRLDAPGRPALFATTEEFLRRFGIGSTENLPDLDPVRAEEIRSEVEEELQVDLQEMEQEAAEREAADPASETKNGRIRAMEDAAEAGSAS